MRPTRARPAGAPRRSCCAAMHARQLRRRAGVRLAPADRVGPGIRPCGIAGEVRTRPARTGRRSQQRTDESTGTAGCRRPATSRQTPWQARSRMTESSVQRARKGVSPAGRGQKDTAISETQPHPHMRPGSRRSLAGLAVVSECTGRYCRRRLQILSSYAWRTSSMEVTLWSTRANQAESYSGSRHVNEQRRSSRILRDRIHRDPCPGKALPLTFLRRPDRLAAFVCCTKLGPALWVPSFVAKTPTPASESPSSISS